MAPKRLGKTKMTARPRVTVRRATPVAKRDKVAADLRDPRVAALLKRLVTAQEEERRRIARNLHDHLGQQITALHLTLSALNDDGSLSDEAKRRLTLAEGIVKTLDRDIDLLARDLRPSALSDIGLSSALADLVRQWTSVTRVPAEFHDSTSDGMSLSSEASANAYRIVQEALNNIARHANASHVSVLLEHRKGETAIIIEDNGCGFDAEHQETSQTMRGGMGLIGMRERAALIDGNLQIESKPGVGTTVFVRIPLDRSTQDPTGGGGMKKAQRHKGRKRHHRAKRTHR